LTFIVAHPCRENNGGCEHLCITAWKRNVATAQCLCSPGYRLHAKTQCKLIKESAFLIYGKYNPTMIRGVSMSKITLPLNNATDDVKEDVIVPITNIVWPIGLDYNVKEQLIYFINKNE